jgi:pSer/pThr/pTyr-binding forkhead associated (FHA) protein
MQVVLVMFRGDGERRSFSIVHDVTVIGRREDCDFRIPLAEISRKHCRLIKDGDALRAEDLGSSNGTYINGLRVQEAQLQPGDTLKVGSVMFVVQIDGVPGDEDLENFTLPPENASEGSRSPESELEDEMLNPTAQSEAGHAPAEDVAVTSPELEEVSELEEVADLEEIGEPPGEAENSEEEFDPHALLNADPESSAAGQGVSESGTEDVSDDLLVEMESNEQSRPAKKP